jgi:acetyl esterase/lipase
LATPAGTRRGRVYDPELAAMRVLLPNLDIADIDAARVIERQLIHEMHARTPVRDVVIEDAVWQRGDGGPLPVRTYRPHGARPAALPAMLFLHGGSFVTGGLHTEHERCASYAEDAACVVVSVDYRLAPEHPFPANLDDCMSALNQLDDQAEELGVDRTRLAVGGLSSGGTLAAGVAQRARNEGGPDLVLQMLLFPVLDAACDSNSMALFDDVPVLNSRTVQTMWQLYLAGDDHVPPRYASPAAEEDLSGLPPTYLCVAELDPLRDEAVEYGQRLLEAGVAVDLRLFARTFHAFDSFTATRLAQAAHEDQVAALRAAFT